jgi:hypothetical protein
MKLGVDLAYLARIYWPKEKVVQLVEMALQAFEAQGIDPLIIVCGLDASDGDEIGLNISRLAEGIVEPIGRTVRIGVRRYQGEIVVMVVDPQGSLRSMQVSTCAIQQGKLAVLGDDFEGWRAIAAEA